MVPHPWRLVRGPIRNYRQKLRGAARNENEKLKNMVKVAKGHVLVLLDKIANTRDDIYVVDKRRQTAANTGIVEQVGEADELGEPIWKEGEKVWMPNVGGQDIEIQGKLYRIIHHRRIIASEADQPDSPQA